MKTISKKEYQEYLKRKEIYKTYAERLGPDDIATIRAQAVYTYLKGMLRIKD